MTVEDREGEPMSDEFGPRPRVETVGKSRLPITSWCCTCDRELTFENGIGPWNHLGDEPDHYVIQVEGRLDIYRNVGAAPVASPLLETPAGEDR